MLARLAPRSSTYQIKKTSNAVWRVLCNGCCAPGASRSVSALGKYGHLERASAWTHLVPSVVFIVSAILRPVLLPSDTTRAVLSGVSIAATGLTFAVSTVYHIYATVPGWAHWTRAADHAAIAVSVAISTLADLAVVTLDFRDVPAQTLLDPLLAMGVVIGFFLTRRLFVSAKETRMRQFDDDTGRALGLSRVYHSDLEHAGLRSATTSTLLLGWVLSIPCALANLGTELATTWIVGATSATALVVASFVASNLFPVETMFKRGVCGQSCAFKTLGCFMESHSWWHVIAASSAILAVVTREVVIAQLAP